MDSGGTGWEDGLPMLDSAVAVQEENRRFSDAMVELLEGGLGG